MAQQFKALAALTEDLSSANSTQVTQLTNKHLLIPALGGIQRPLLASAGIAFRCSGVVWRDEGRKKVYILSHDLNIYIYNI